MDNFREWLSDNLRYFMLGGAILLIVIVMFFGVRACIGSKKGDSGEGQTTVVDNNQGNVPSSPDDDGETNDGKKEEEDTNPLVESDAEITALMQKYYKALGDKDVATLKTLVDDLPSSDESKITNAKDYIEEYQVGDVYTKKGMDEKSYVVYVDFHYICKGITTPVPALSWSYVVEDSEGNLMIDGSAIQNEQISAYVDTLALDEDVAKLTNDIQDAYEKAQEDDPVLKEFLDGLGEEVDSSVAVEEGTILTVTDDCNVRDSAGGEIIGGYPVGTQIEKKGEDGEWIIVDYEGQDGYIHNSLLEEAN